MFHGYLVTKVGFPSQPDALVEARECLEEMQVQFEDDGVELEDGMYLPFHNWPTTVLIINLGYEIGENMDMLVCVHSTAVSR